MIRHVHNLPHSRVHLLHLTPSVNHTYPGMASRRAALLHSQLSAVARQCEVAHTRWAIAAAGSAAWQAPTQLHTVQQHALQIAAGSVAAQWCSWTASRGFAADAAQVADSDESAGELEFTEAAVEVCIVLCMIFIAQVSEAAPALVACRQAGAALLPVFVVRIPYGSSPQQPPGASLTDRRRLSFW